MVRLTVYRAKGEGMSDKKRKPISELLRLFIDFETGGFDFLEDPIIEAGWVVTDPSAREVLFERSFKIFPWTPLPEIVDTKSGPKPIFEVNGYDPAVWEREAVVSFDALVQLVDDSEGAIFVAHNAPFDWPFLHVALARLGLKWRGDHHRICTCALAMPLADRGIVESVSLEALAKHFGISQPTAHRALADARTCREVYLKLIEAPRLEVEQAVTAERTRCARLVRVRPYWEEVVRAIETGSER